MSTKRKTGIASFECGSGNTMVIEFPNVVPPKKKHIYIILKHYKVSEQIITSTIKINNKSSKKQFYVISANSVADAYKQLKEYIGDDKVDNIVITAHGAGAEGESCFIDTGITQISIKNLRHYKRITQEFKEESTFLTKKPKHFTRSVWSKEKLDEAESLFKIGQSISEKGTFLITACGSGKEPEFGKLLLTFIDNDINLLLNRDNSQLLFRKTPVYKITQEKGKSSGKTYSKKKEIVKHPQIKLDNILSNGDEPIKGWYKFCKGIDNEITIKNVYTIKLNNSDKNKPVIEELTKN